MVLTFQLRLYSKGIGEQIVHQNYCNGPRSVLAAPPEEGFQESQEEAPIEGAPDRHRSSDLNNMALKYFDIIDDVAAICGFGGGGSAQYAESRALVECIDHRNDIPVVGYSPCMDLAWTDGTQDPRLAEAAARAVLYDVLCVLAGVRCFYVSN